MDGSLCQSRKTQDFVNTSDDTQEVNSSVYNLG